MQIMHEGMKSCRETTNSRIDAKHFLFTEKKRKEVDIKNNNGINLKAAYCVRVLVTNENQSRIENEIFSSTRR